MGTYLLVDGHSLAFRAWFALQDAAMTTSGGQETTVVYGFVSMVTRMLGDWRPDGLAVVFDRPEPTFRDEIVTTYKAGRAAAPDTFHAQVDLVRRFVELLRVPVIEVPGVEADDVIATLAASLSEAGEDVIIVTGDRDTYQLVKDPHVRVLYNRRGVTDYVLYDEAGIRERTGVDPAHYAFLASLRGDPSDNLPGVPGVGEKTAAKLVNTYGDVGTLYAHLADLTPKLRASLAECEAQVRQNLAVIPLLRDVEVDLELPGDLRLGRADVDGLRQLFGLLEMRAVRDRLLDILADLSGGAGAGGSGPAAGTEGAPAGAARVDLESLVAGVVHLDSPASAVAALGELPAAGAEVVVEPEWSGRPGEAAAAPEGGEVAAAPEGGEVAWTAYHLGPQAADDEAVAAALTAFLSDAHFAAHRSKELIRWFGERFGGDVTGLGLDTALAAYLVDPGEGQAALDEIAARHGLAPGGAPAAASTGEMQLSLDLEGTASPPWVATLTRAATIAELAPRLQAVLGSTGAEQLYEDVERPLVRVLAKMELRGIGVDVDRLREINERLTKEVRALEEEIQEIAGEPFKVNSTPQLRRILFDKLHLVSSRKTKTGYSTDATALERMQREHPHPIIDKLLRYREVEKLRSTYGEGLLSEVGEDGRIHASFNQTVARTGRLSSDQPNLHNIPVRSEEGREIRAAFVPAKGTELLVADYNQIELRVIAHLAEDPGLVEAFTSGTDIHNATASRVFAVEPAAVTIAQRSKAKMISYGLAYGMEAYGLSQRLGIPVEEAKVILDAYFVAFPAVRAYMDRTVAESRLRGYTETLYGRRRYLPDLDAPNYRVRMAAERQAMNAGIQGLAADIFKVALVRLDAALESAGYAASIVLQVHDEVLLEVPFEEHDAVGELTGTVMRGACELRVPLEVHLSWGPSWAEAKGA
jgi:DNA polymerase-1